MRGKSTETADLGSNPARILRHRYILALSIIALLIILSQIFIQLTMAKNNDDGRVINISGRQRMLSQKITKLSLQILAAPSAAERAVLAADLQAATGLWAKSHDGLLQGSTELGLYGRNSAATLAIYDQIEKPFRAILESARELARKAIPGAKGEVPPETEIRALVSTIERNEGAFLSGMNAITFQYDKETKDRVGFISLLEYILLGITCLTLSLEAALIFLPAERQIHRYFREMKKVMSLLEVKASYDSMTGIFNKSTGLALLTQEIERSRRSHEPLSLCFIDLDGLKTVNDKWGHEEGDLLISRFAAILKDSIRAGDTAFRFGGDEFVLCLACGERKAEEVLARLRAGVEAENKKERKPYRLDFSSGCVTLTPDGALSMDEFLHMADTSMYEEKQRKKAARA
jgi:diguanylate cyclase (GGDEF)-like protein